MTEVYYKKAADSFVELLKIMDRLRAECPWDRKQTNESLRSLTIEEVHELSDAILEDNEDEIKKELGDILLHIVFYSKIGNEKGAFTVSEMIDTICEKLIFRHPHIFGDVEVQDEEEVKQNWEKLKMKEGRKSVLEGVPRSLTGLLKAYRLQDKAAGVGFDWNDGPDALLEGFTIENSSGAGLHFDGGTAVVSGCVGHIEHAPPRLTHLHRNMRCTVFLRFAARAIA